MKIHKTLIVLFFLLIFNVVGFLGIGDDVISLSSNEATVAVVYAADNEVPPLVNSQNKSTNDPVSNTNLVILGIGVFMLITLRIRTSQN
ncbi:MAG: hypothetical protein HKM93_17525 [Desulfobacteraceae bacterium]|nr:hypothetical protein [Desulfobacteraceae bacterium]